MAGKGARAAGGNDSHGAGAFRVQNQIRRNAQDMQEYLADLGSWEKSIKKKDKQLSRKASADVSNASHGRRVTPPAAAAVTTNTPPIRRSGGAVSISSGPAPDASVAAAKKYEYGSSLASRVVSQQDSSGTGDGSEGSRRSREERVASDKMKGGNERETAATGSSAARHTHDKGYDKWAKFDVDAALRGVDHEDDGAGLKRRVGSNSSDSDTDADGSEEAAARADRLTPVTMVDRSARQGNRRAPTVARPPPPRATSFTAAGTTTVPRDFEKEERERGNASFGGGDFEGAVKSYTRCVAMNSKSSLAFSNRAMAYLKLKEFGKAEADCDAALRLDPRHVKSLQRRAAARNALGKHRAALGDLQAAAEIDPSSKEIRKDLGKTLETLKTVVRRAPKTRVKVQSESLPAPKPRGYSPSSGHGQASCPRPPPARPAASIFDANSAATATGTNAPVTSGEHTVAPFSSVLRETAHGRTDDTTGARVARTFVEELPDEVGAPAALLPASGSTNAASSAQDIVLPVAPSAAAPPEDRAADVTTSASPVAVGGGQDTGSAVGVTAVGSALPPEVTGSLSHESRVATGAATAAPVAVTRAAPSETENVKPPPAVVAPGPCPAPSKVLEADSDQSERLSVADARTKYAQGTALQNGNISPEVAHPARGETAALPSVKSAKQKPKKTSAPTHKRPTAAASATAPGAVPQTQQLPTTGYQFEQMWRSTEGSPEARLELLRAVPPSSVSKIFRRTPLEVDLLGGILQRLAEAFLPRRPSTALRWLKNLSKASRFGMTVALLGEGDGRAAVRELLVRLEASPSAKTELEEVEALRKLYALC